jgi:hypothetical protein
VELLEASRIETVKVPVELDLVFPASMVGVNGVVYTGTESRVAIAFPVGFDSRIYKEYTLPTNGMEAFPVLFITKLYEVFPFGDTPEFP